MSLLLCRQEACTPYYIEKTDIKVKSLQELCYMIYNYPLTVMDELINEDLIRWIGSELSMGILSERLSKLMKAGESPENIFCLILREGNYYTADETAGFKTRLSALLRLDREKRAVAKAASYFKLGRYAEAGECYAEAEKYLSERIRKNVTEGREALLLGLSEIKCDEAVCRMRLFDEKSAKKLLLEGAKIAKNSRAAQYLYLMDENAGAAFVSDEEKSELKRKKADAEERAYSGMEYRKVLDIFAKDAVKRDEEIEELVSEWKSIYRKMV